MKEYEEFCFKQDTLEDIYFKWCIVSKRYTICSSSNMLQIVVNGQTNFC